MKALSVHRFGDSCALAILGQDGETVYFPAEAARQLAANLNACAESIERETFGAHTFRADSISIGNGSKS